MQMDKIGMMHHEIWDLGFGIWDFSKSKIKNPKSKI